MTGRELGHAPGDAGRRDARAPMNRDVPFMAGSGFAGKTGEQFVRGDGGGAEFAHDNAGGVIGKIRGLDGRRARHDGKGEGGDDGVARAGHIKDLAGGGGDMERLLAALAEEHALFAQGDEEQGRLKVRQQFVRHPPQARRRWDGSAPWRSSGRPASSKASLRLGVRRDKPDKIQKMGRLGVHAQPDAARAAQPPGFIQQRLGDDAFGVVAQNQGVGASGGALASAARRRAAVSSSMSPRVSRSTRTTCWRWATMRVLMLVARFGAGQKAGAADAVAREQLVEPARGLVVPGDAEQFGGDAQLGQVAGDIARAAGNETLALKFHHRHRRFGRNARDRCPKETGPASRRPAR